MADRIAKRLGRTIMDDRKVATYRRCSTLAQVEKDTLDTQLSRLRNHILNLNYSEFRDYVDAGYSGGTLNRPDFQRLLRDIKSRKIKEVYAIRLDRVSRKMRDILEITDILIENDVNLRTLDDHCDLTSSSNRLLKNIIMVVSEFERENVQERVSRAMLTRAGDGKWNGGIVPLGYQTQATLVRRLEKEGVETGDALKIATAKCPDPKKLYVHEEEARIVRLIYGTFLDVNSIRGVTRTLNDRAIFTRDGKPWANTSSHRILTNPLYIGQICYGKRRTKSGTTKLVKQNVDDWITAQGEHEPIIDISTYDMVQRKLKEHSGKPTKSGRHYLLSGVARCAHCKMAMAGQTFRKKGTFDVYSYYKCSGRSSKGTCVCKGVSLPAKELEDAVVAKISEQMHQLTFIGNEKPPEDMLEEKYKYLAPNIEGELERLTEMKVDAETRKRNLIEALSITKMPGSLSESIQTEIKKLTNLEETIKAEEMRLREKVEYREEIAEIMQSTFDKMVSFTEGWDALDPIAKSLRLRSIVKQIFVSEEEITITLYSGEVANMSSTDTGSSHRRA
jgi:site-specific DNA recombinase